MNPISSDHVWMSPKGYSRYPHQASLHEHGVVQLNDEEDDIYEILWDNGHRNTYRRSDFFTEEEMKKKNIGKFASLIQL